jgi:gas vesicle protein
VSPIILCMKQFNFHKQITPLFLLLTLLALITGCATVREQTIVPAYPGTLTYYSSYGRPLYPFDPNYCDPFLGEPFCSSYKSFHDPYWYYYNAYFYPYPPYYPFYPYSPYYGYYYNDDDHHHRRGLRHIINDWADDRKDARDTVTDRGNEWREKSKKRWDEIESAIRERRDARMEQWQGIRESVQDRVREMGEERRGNFLNNAGNAFSRIGEQRQERIEQRRDFFKGHGLFRNDNHQPLFNGGDTNNGSGSGLFNGGVLRGWGGKR